MKKCNEYEQFVLCAYAGLVLRGYDRASDILDPILRDVWRLGRKLDKRTKAKASRRD